MLKVLLLRKKIDELNKQLRDLKAVDFEKREADLATAIEELTAESTAEERSAVEEAIEKFEAEKTENSEQVEKLEKAIEEVEEEIRSLEEEAPAPQVEEAKPEERKEIRTMDKREFFGMNLAERSAFFENEDTKSFLGTVRQAIADKRAITNVGLTIPDVMLPLIKQVVYGTSKVAPFTNIKSVPGKGRQTIMGDIPEGVWTEMAGVLNELTLAFTQVEVDGYKVGGYFAVANCYLEDSDIALTQELISAIGQSIAIALDKAILYGTGTKMPLGVVKRLATATAPTGWNATTMGTYADLHESNIITGTGATGLALFKEIVSATGVIDNKYSKDGLVWFMNAKTRTKLQVNSMDKNLNAAIVAGMNGEMPVAGGKIVELNFVPDDNIVFGYFKNYLLAERAGVKLASSEHAKFIQDQTVFKGTARYDGRPVIPQAFAVLSLTTTAPTTTMSFAADTAN